MFKYWHLWAGLFALFVYLTPAECFASGFRSYFTRTSFSPVVSDAAKITSRSTTYVGQVMAYQNGEEPDATIAVRKGEFAMLIYSIGQLFFNFQTLMCSHYHLSCCCRWHFPPPIGSTRSSFDAIRK